MRGVFLTYVSSSEGNRKLVPRMEDHVIIPQLGDHDVLIQVKACALSRMDTRILTDLRPNAEEFPVGSEVSGVVAKVGALVSSFAADDEVCGIIPLDSDFPGCAEFCVVPEYCLLRKSTKVTHAVCAAALRSGVRAHTALFLQSKIDSKQVVAVFSSTSADGQTIIQLCEAVGSKVIAIVNNLDEASLMSQLYPNLYKIIDMSSVKNLVDVCLHETGGIGVNVVVDSGVSPGYALSDFIIDSPALVQQLKSESERYGGEFTQSSVILPSKHQIINMLAPQGQWVTAQPDLQLEPPETRCLFLKGASVHFLFDPVWTLSNSQQGRYLHILQSVMDKLKENVLKPFVFKTIPLQGVCEELTQMGMYHVGKLIMLAEH